MEAYAVDHNRYPCYGSPLDYVRNGDEAETMAPARLTTPIGYLTTLPNDVFQRRDNTEPNPVHPPFYQHDYAETYLGIGNEVDDLHDEKARKYLGADHPGLRWVLWSHGPDLDDDEAENRYDPTNGTVSNGDIARFGP